MHTINELSWDFANPHILKFQVDESNIDILGHVNNKVYLDWSEITLIYLVSHMKILKQLKVHVLWLEIGLNI
jgi:acyl-CoA thioesterase FadM